MKENKISNCEFLFQCPLRWEDLETTNNHETRFCQTCSKPVHLAHDEEEFNRFGSEGKCVAIAKPATDATKCHICLTAFDPKYNSRFCRMCGSLINLSGPEPNFRQMPMGMPASTPLSPPPKKRCGAR